MFLRTSIFALFLTSFQLQAGEIEFNVAYCTKEDFIKQTKSELMLCAPKCPLKVIDIVNQCIQENTDIVEIPSKYLLGNSSIMIFKKTDRSPGCW